MSEKFKLCFDDKLINLLSINHEQQY